MVGRTTYFLHMTFVLMVMPVFVPFSLTAHLQATWEGIGMYGVVTSMRYRADRPLSHPSPSCSCLQFHPPFPSTAAIGASASWSSTVAKARTSRPSWDNKGWRQSWLGSTASGRTQPISISECRFIPAKLCLRYHQDVVVVNVVPVIFKCFPNSVLTFQAVEGSNLKTRLYVALSDLGSNKMIQDISMTCDHSVTLTGLEIKGLCLLFLVFLNLKM